MASTQGALSRRDARALPAAAGSKPLVDWQYLFAAVRDRLRATVAEPDVRLGERPQVLVLRRIQSDVLECVGALDQLHGTLASELRRSRRLEHDLVRAQAELARLHAVLDDSLNAARRAQHLARHDELTRLVNRSFFHERLEQSIAQAAALALVYIDLDAFKPINDRHGHDVGDEVLRIVATRLKHSVRAEDLVGRIGGDEFACMLANMPSREQLDQVAAKLRSAVCAPLTIGTLDLTVSASIGIAICPLHGNSATALFRSADAAMYHSKKHSMGHAFFDDAGMARHGAQTAA